MIILMIMMIMLMAVMMMIIHDSDSDDEDDESSRNGDKNDIDVSVLSSNRSNQMDEIVIDLPAPASEKVSDKTAKRKIKFVKLPNPKNGGRIVYFVIDVEVTGALRVQDRIIEIGSLAVAADGVIVDIVVVVVAAAHRHRTMIMKTLHSMALMMAPPTCSRTGIVHQSHHSKKDQGGDGAFSKGREWQEVPKKKLRGTNDVSRLQTNIHTENKQIILTR